MERKERSKRASGDIVCLGDDGGGDAQVLSTTRRWVKDAAVK